MFQILLWRRAWDGLGRDVSQTVLPPERCRIEFIDIGEIIIFLGDIREDVPAEPEDEEEDDDNELS